jgi:alcohol dehydrogenase class IV
MVRYDCAMSYAALTVGYSRNQRDVWQPSASQLVGIPHVDVGPVAMKQDSYEYVPLERVQWGSPSAEAVAAEIKRLTAQRVFIVSSRTLARKTDVVTTIREALGARDAGLFDECKEHTPLQTVLDCAEAVRQAAPDLILTIGGGSVIDTTKIVQLTLTHDIRNMASLLSYADRPTDIPSVIRQIIIPTTLSGSEFTSRAGGLDTSRKHKSIFTAPDMCGRVVILDPRITRYTPEWLWLSTAVRSIDHAIEGYCAVDANPFIRGTALHALRLLFSSLRRTKQDPTDLEARLKSQQAVWLATTGVFHVPMGASHGIGYLLGSMGGVPHGYTSCVMLPAVLRWNEAATAHLQRDVAEAIGMPNRSAADGLAALLDDLGLPRKLSDVGITNEMLPKIADRAIESPVVLANPRPIKSRADILEILSLAS